MALRVTEFFGYAPLDPASASYVADRHCPFVRGACIKPNHGSCSVQQPTEQDPVICCPNRMYGGDFQILHEIAAETFGPTVSLVPPSEISRRAANGTMSGDEVVVFGRYWGQELPLPRPRGRRAAGVGKYYLDWILAKVDPNIDVEELTAVEVQTIDTTGSYRDQTDAFFAGRAFTDKQGRTPGYSGSNMNWENVNKRILPQLIYKGHVLRREAKCSKGLYFVCPRPVYDRIRDRLGGDLHEYHPSTGTITFRSYELAPAVSAGRQRGMTLSAQFTTTVDQVAVAFTAPVNLPAQNVYVEAINAALRR